MGERILINTAEIENYCFGEDEQPVSTYRKLKLYDEQWLDSRPLSFLPLSYRAADAACGEIFPEIWYMNNAVGQWSVSSLTKICHANVR